MNSVLVIDDASVVCAIMESVLETEGYAVTSVGDAQTGISRSSEINPDPDIVDILKPGKEGTATILELREANPEARILAMTGGSNFAAGDVLHIAGLLVWAPTTASENRLGRQYCWKQSNAVSRNKDGAPITHQRPHAERAINVRKAGPRRVAGSLEKPFTPRQLLTAVRLCLAQRGATRGSPRR